MCQLEVDIAWKDVQKVRDKAIMEMTALQQIKAAVRISMMEEAIKDIPVSSR